MLVKVYDRIFNLFSIKEEYLLGLLVVRAGVSPERTTTRSCHTQRIR